MRKLLFKKLLNILDYIELHGVALQNTSIRLQEELMKEHYIVLMSDLEDIVQYLHKTSFLVATANGIDLRPAPTIYAKSNQNSESEALAIMESFLHMPILFDRFYQLARNNHFITKEIFFKDIDARSTQLLTQSVLFEQRYDMIQFHPKYIGDIIDILEEYKESNPLLSTTLALLFTTSIVRHDNRNVSFKNEDRTMIAYPRRNVILSKIQRKGIPHDRDETKALQSFYKDTLFHEFDHACPICGITIAHMLIASHIKPFRDCAHIYEAVDHNNGLLLCRNHDYLFDQGYFSFDDKGNIMIANELEKKGHLEDIYTIKRVYQLPKEYLTVQRLLFLKYHNLHIFKDASNEK